MRRPIVEPTSQALEGSEILTRLADKLGIIPTIPESLYEAAGKSRLEYGQALFTYLKSDPKPLLFFPLSWPKH